jgi:transcriptional regulator with XRE-family HTH domain
MLGIPSSLSHIPERCETASGPGVSPPSHRESRRARRPPGRLAGGQGALAPGGRGGLTGKAVSNAYLSQLEHGKIKRPSPNVLHSLAEVYAVPYEALMEKAGYPAALRGRRRAPREVGGVRGTLFRGRPGHGAPALQEAHGFARKRSGCRVLKNAASRHHQARSPGARAAGYADGARARPSRKPDLNGCRSDSQRAIGAGADRMNPARSSAPAARFNVGDTGQDPRLRPSP